MYINPALKESFISFLREEFYSNFTRHYMDDAGLCTVVAESAKHVA